jgi:hypothetical protein
MASTVADAWLKGPRDRAQHSESVLNGLITHTTGSHYPDLKEPVFAHDIEPVSALATLYVTKDPSSFTSY